MNREPRGVSPVIAVILMVAVTVVLSATIGAFVFDLGQSTTETEQQSLGIGLSQTENGVELTVVTGNSDKLRVFLNDEPVQTIYSPQPGDSVTITGSTGDEITVISTRDGEENVIPSPTITDTPSFQKGLVAHYRFGAGEGDTAYDSVGDNEGIIHASWVENERGTSVLDLDGVDDAVTIGSNTTTHFDGTNPFTVCFEITFDTSGEQDVFSPRATYDWMIQYNATGSQRIRLHNSDGPNSGNIYTSSSIPTGEWTHVCTVYHGNGSGEMFINGQLDATGTIQQDPRLTTYTYVDTIGYEFEYTDGKIDDFRIYNRSLSEQDVSNLYEAIK